MVYGLMYRACQPISIQGSNHPVYPFDSITEKTVIYIVQTNAANSVKFNLLRLCMAFPLRGILGEVRSLEGTLLTPYASKIHYDSYW
jgi:hypothetical protein